MLCAALERSGSITFFLSSRVFGRMFYAWFAYTTCFIVLQKGWQQICVESPGVHELHFTDAYVFFGAHAFYFDTAKPSVSGILQYMHGWSYSGVLLIF